MHFSASPLAVERPGRHAGRPRGRCVIPAKAGIQYASPPAGEAGGANGTAGWGGPQCHSYASRNPEKKQLDSHFRGNDLQGGFERHKASGFLVIRQYHIEPSFGENITRAEYLALRIHL